MELDFEYPKDRHVKIDYISSFLCVRIEWYLIDAAIGVGLIELENGRVPGKYSYFEKEGFARAIRLTTLVEFLTNGELKDPLPKAGAKARTVKITTAWREREELIHHNMKGVIAAYSNWLKEYASDILKGDTSIFRDVQEYEQKSITQNYY